MFYRMKLIKLAFLIILIGIVLISLFLLANFLPTSLSDEKIRFVIPLDVKQEEIVARLKSEDFIRSPDFFTFIAGIIRYPGSIEPGSYMLSRRMTVFTVADTLLNHPYQKWIILVPGLRREQVAERLAKKFNWTNLQSKEFLDIAKEGYLHPDTYLFNVDYTPREFVQKMLNNFNEKFDAQIQKDLLARNVKNDTAVKIASLIERETGSDEDKPIIAGIIWNRLNIGMRLEIDATIQYAIGTTSDWWPILTGRKLRSIESDYNTYIIKGLPPGPICNPSLASIKAAAYPAETDCLFYLHDHNKQIHCSKTYTEHLQNIEKYLK